MKDVLREDLHGLLIDFVHETQELRTRDYGNDIKGIREPSLNDFLIWLKVL